MGNRRLEGVNVAAHAAAKLCCNDAQGYCALYGTAGHRADKDALDRPNNTRAQPVAGDAYRSLQEVCPQLTSEAGGATGRYCCDDRQIHDLSTKVSAPPSLLDGR